MVGEMSRNTLIILVTLLLLLSKHSFGQNDFFQLGSSYHYLSKDYGWTPPWIPGEDTLTVRFAKDTTLFDKECIKIEQNLISCTNYIYGDHFVYYENDVLYYYGEDWVYQGFDTVMNFNAQVGESWKIGLTQITVLDLDTILVDGQERKNFEVQYTQVFDTVPYWWTRDWCSNVIEGKGDIQFLFNFKHPEVDCYQGNPMRLLWSEDSEGEKEFADSNWKACSVVDNGYREHLKPFSLGSSWIYEIRDGFGEPVDSFKVSIYKDSLYLGTPAFGVRYSSSDCSGEAVLNFEDSVIYLAVDGSELDTLLDFNAQRFDSWSFGDQEFYVNYADWERVHFNENGIVLEIQFRNDMGDWICSATSSVIGNHEYFFGMPEVIGCPQIESSALIKYDDYHAHLTFEEEWFPLAEGCRPVQGLEERIDRPLVEVINQRIKLSSGHCYKVVNLQGRTIQEGIIPQSDLIDVHAEGMHFLIVDDQWSFKLLLEK